jgi:hypothetical protein
MATYVRYVPEDRELDLARLTQADYQLITDLHGQIRRGEPALICLRPGGQSGEMFIRRRGGRYFAAHFPGGGHGEHQISLESPAHRRQKDYWVRGAQAAGLSAATEYPVRGGRLDVAITGGKVQTDIEIQRSEITPSTAKRRTTKYHKGRVPAGVVQRRRTAAAVAQGSTGPRLQPHAVGRGASPAAGCYCHRPDRYRGRQMRDQRL